MMKWFKLLLFTLTLTLFGCGGGDDNATSNSGNSGGGDITPPIVQPVDGTLKAMSVSLATPVREANSAALTTLSLQPYVWSKDNKTLSLADVKALSDTSACQVANIQAERLSFSLPANHSGACLYRYTVTDQSQQATGVIRLLISPNSTGVRFNPLPAGNELSDINQSLSLGDTLSLDLSTDPAIASEVTGMNHPQFSATTIVSGSGSATLTPEGQFSYQAIAPGATEVMYYILDDQYTENVQDDEVYIGRVLISVSGSTNTPPTADNGVLLTPIVPGSAIEIDVANFPDAPDGTLIHDSDASLLHKEPLQLVSVQAEGAFVALSAPDDVTNTKFNVQAPTFLGEGYHLTIVHYAIYDHNEDGVAQGNIRLLTGKALTAITIAPADDTSGGVSALSIPKGRRQGFVAIGTFDDGSQEYVTNDVIWDSGTPSVASINSSGGAKGLSVGHTNISANITTLDGRTLNSNKIDLEVTDAELVNFWLTPSRQSLPLGATGNITATGLYTDGSSTSLSDVVSWSTTPTGIASIDTSLVGTTHPAADVHADSEGEARIMATYKGMTSLNTAQVTVTEKIVKQVQLSIQDSSSSKIKMAVGQRKKLKAVAVYSDASTLNVTEDPNTIWESGDDTIAAFTNPTGFPYRIEGISEGETTATATYDGVNSNVMPVIVSPAKVKSIQVTPPSISIPKGERYDHLIATATMTDGSSTDITADATWDSTNTGVATVSTGEVYGANVGNTVITASYLNPGTSTPKVSNEVNVDVTDAVVKEVHITTTPDPVSIPAGASKLLEAEAVYSDGHTENITSTATWSTTAPAIASITSPGGLVTADGSSGNTTTATASYEGHSDTIGLLITDAEITSIDVAPPNLSLPVSTTQQYTATATYTDGDTVDITSSADTAWSTTDASLATVSATGYVVTNSTNTGSLKVQAKNGSLIGETGLNVVEAILESIEVDKTVIELEVGDTKGITATGHYSNGSQANITTDPDTSWYVDNSSIATVATGQVTGVAPGSVVTRASQGTIVSDDVDITVKAPPTLIEIEVPSRMRGYVNKVCSFVVTRIYDDGSRDAVPISEMSSVSTIFDQSIIYHDDDGYMYTEESSVKHSRYEGTSGNKVEIRVTTNTPNPVSFDTPFKDYWNVSYKGFSDSISINVTRDDEGWCD
ncbi:Ig-like domain-containing protein [Vibrio parahaemolyticus]|uniref:Ig-like domain-containing protein n=1 Tax=Vibrio parahaemolyticus TaxID=670 RepID=UPI001E38C2A6|nr:Ig-like domain-containing protein [Vibrio parahaemolyticus]MCD1416900.1 Ig-like domain-containing protein [Vibrio parahaemolyticus]